MLNYKTLKAGLLIFLLAMSMIMTAQTTQNKNFQPAFAAGYIFGANLSPHQYNYASGASFKAIIQHDVLNASSVGILAGLNHFSGNTFYPVGLTFHLKQDKLKAAGFLIETGYTFAKSEIEEINWRYEMRGSMFVPLGAKWSYPILDCFILQPSISTIFHNSTLTYSSEAGKTYSIEQDQIGLLVHIGILFN
jgi:hypothetical protein